MFTALKKSWRALRDAPPGERFLRYHRAHHEAGRPVWRRVLSVGIAVGVLIVGVVALPAPGPGTLVIILGLALLGRELRRVAKGLDWVETKLRGIVRWFTRTWRGTSLAGRVGLAAVVIVLALVILAPVAYAAYRVVLR